MRYFITFACYATRLQGGESGSVERRGSRRTQPSAPPPREDYADLLVPLARKEHPDTSSFANLKIAWRIAEPHHVGMIVKSPQGERVAELLDDHVEHVKPGFLTSARAADELAA